MKYLAALSALFLPLASHAAEYTWLVGFWHQTEDEDNTGSDVMEFRADGTYQNYGFNCVHSSSQPFHVFGGDIYVTSEISGKGPIAIVFRPSDDLKRLTFTSPRTRHNAVYERLPTNPCGAKS
jgi:hypothetical protein